MAEIITTQKLIDADIDVDNLGKAANELGTVNPRYGNPYKTAPQTIQDLQQKADQVVAQGFYQGYTTEALLLAAKPAVAEMRARADDTRKIYRWTRTSADGVTPVAGTWTDTGLSDKDLAATDATTKANAAQANAIATAATDATTKANAAQANAKDYFKNNADVRFEAVNPININYTTADGNLTFSGNIYVITSAGTKVLTTPQVLNLLSNKRYRIEYDIFTNTLRAVEYNDARSDGWAIAGIVTVSTSGITTSDFAYFVNGAIPVDTPSEYGELINTVPNRIAFDTVAKTLAITSAVRVISASYTYAPPSTVTIDFPSSAGSYSLVFNKSNRTFSFRTQSTVSEKNDVVLAYVTFAATTFIPSVTGISSYAIDGLVPAEDPSEYGELYNTAPARISFDTTAKTLTMTAAVRVLSAGFTYLPSSSAVVPFPTTAGAYSLVFNKITKVFSFKTRTSVAGKNDIVLDYVDFAATTFSPTVRRIESYVIDGVTLGKYSDLKVAYTGELIANDDLALDFDFRNSKIRVAPLRLSSSGTTRIPPSQDIEITGFPTVWKKLVYNTATRLFSMKEITSVAADGAQDLIVAYFYPSEKRVYGVAKYAINGRVVKGLCEPIQNADFRTPYGDVTSTYSGRTLPELNTLYTSIGVDLAAFYALYDALVAAYPTYITKTNLGADKDGNPIHQYQFNAPEVPTVVSASMKPKIIILSNIHGWEKACTYVLYQSLKEICEQWQNNESLEALRWGANIIVVPVINPSGFISLSRKNSNGVDLERNFPTGWAQGLPTDETYGGAAPLSEPEAVIVDNLISNNTDAIQFMSCHSFSGMTTTFLPNGLWTWLPLATDFGINLAKSLIMKNSIQSKKLYPFINVDYVGYTDKGAPGGASSYHATRYYGVQGGTFEICGRMYWEPGQPFLSEAVVTCGSNLIINWLLMNIKYATELYNSRVNI